MVEIVDYSVGMTCWLSDHELTYDFLMTDVFERFRSLPQRQSEAPYLPPRNLR